MVPAHWPVEVLSALIQGKRRRRIKDAEITNFLADLLLIPIRLDDMITTSELASLKALSDRFDLNAFDAAYLALATRPDYRWPQTTSHYNALVSALE